MERECQAGLPRQILQHWLEHRPKMCAELEQKGILHQVVYAMAIKAADIEVEATREGMNYDRAHELALHEWALPDEEDQPNLTFDPATLLQPV